MFRQRLPESKPFMHRAAIIVADGIAAPMKSRFKINLRGILTFKRANINWPGFVWNRAWKYRKNIIAPLFYWTVIFLPKNANRPIMHESEGVPRHKVGPELMISGPGDYKCRSLQFV